MSNKKYPEEFKKEAIRLIRDRGERVSSVSAKLGVSKNTLYKWNKGSNIVEKEGDKDKLIKELSKALRLAEEERDILKKAAAYFAKVSR